MVGEGVTTVSVERLAKLEANQENMASSMAKIADSQLEMARTLTRVTTQQEEISRIQSRQGSYDHRLTVAEGDIKALIQQTAPLAGISERLAKNTFITGITAWLAGVVVVAFMGALMFYIFRQVGP